MFLSCRIRWIIGILFLIAPSAVVSMLILARQADVPVLDRCRWTSLGALVILATGLTWGIMLIFGCHARRRLE